MRASNVDAIQMCDSSVALRNVDVLELYVHVVLSYFPVSLHLRLPLLSPSLIAICGPERTFDELSTVCLARVDLHCDLMSLESYQLQILV